MEKVKCNKCGDVLEADGFVKFTYCKCKKTFVDGLGVKDMYRVGGEKPLTKKGNKWEKVFSTPTHSK